MCGLAVSGAVTLGQDAGAVEPDELALGADVGGQTGSGPRLLSWGAIWENDGAFIKPYKETDRHYTNGAQIDFAFDHLLPESWIDLVPGAGRFENMSEATGVLIGQLIFTSEDIERRERRPGDRPYGGWLYVGLYYQRADDKKLDHFELDIGAVGGDWSAAESVQTFVHAVVPGEVTPQGWDEQLENEIGVNLKYQRRWRFRPDPDLIDRPLFDMDFIPEAGFMLGNVFTNANAAVTLRLGTNLPDNFGPARIAQFRDVTGTSRGNWSAYVFGRIGGQFVAHNIFLDGNTFESSVSVAKEQEVGEAALGIALRYKKIEFGWSTTWRTREFKDQDQIDSFGAISLTWQTTF